MADEDFSLGIFPDRCEKQNKKKHLPTQLCL